ncbi:PAS domain S-box protein [[Phormidium] sp. ETS-05]|uniref:PAS domain S-box protein n=1 Tax=[Phormidium] sp. ETS-05 TaxID=222819 RepID=UPI0018EF29F4
MSELVENFWLLNLIYSGECTFGQSSLIWLQTISDGIIAVCYYTISLILLQYIRNYKNLSQILLELENNARWILAVLCAFILATGTTHTIEIWMLWSPVGANSSALVAGSMKAITAIVGLLAVVGTRYGLSLGWIRLRDYQSLPVREQKEAESEILKLNARLEARMEERSAQLEANNEMLLREIDRRRTHEQRWRTIIANAPIILYATDREGMITFAEGKGLEALGLAISQAGFTNLKQPNLKQLFGQPQSNDRTDPDNPDIKNQIEKCLQGEAAGWIALVNGRFYDNRITPVEEGGVITGMIGVATDITERIEAQTAWRNSEARWHLAIQGANDGIWDWDMQRDTVFFSDRWYEIFGLDPIEGSGELETWTKHIHPEDWENVMGAIQDHLNHKTNRYMAEYRIQCADGSTKVVSDRGVAQWDDAGSAVRMVVATNDITERKQAETTLRRQALVFENLYDGVIITDINGMILDWNGGAERILGYTKAAAIGQNLEMLRRPEDVGLTEQIIPTMLNQGRWMGMVTFVRQDGSYCLCEKVVLPLRDAAGEMVGTIGVNRDITEQNRLQQDQERFFELSLEMLCVAGFDGYFKQLNPAWETTLGYTKEELFAQPFLDFVHPEDRESTISAAVQLAAGQAVVAFENRYRCRDGSYKWFLWKSASFPEENTIYAVAHDITYLKESDSHRAELIANLQEFTTLQKAILDSTNYTIISTTTDGIIRTFNKAAERLLGYNAVDVIDKTTPAIIHDTAEVVRRSQELSEELGETIEPGFEVFVAKARRGEVEERRWSYIRADGTRFPVLLSITALRDAEDNITGFMGIARDITDLVQAEAEKARLLAELQDREAGIRELYECTIVPSHSSIVPRPMSLDQGQRTLDVGQKLERMLSMGCRRFDMEIGTVGRVVDDRYEVVAACFPSEPFKILQGDAFALQMLYDEAAFNQPEPLCINAAGLPLPDGSPGLWQNHPAFTLRQLQSYIGIRVMVGGSPWGTVGFASRMPRTASAVASASHKLEAKDQQLLQLMAQWVGEKSSERRLVSP